MEKNRILYWGRMQLPDKNALAHRVIANCYALNICGFSPVLVGYSMDKRTSKKVIETKFKLQEFDAYEIPYPQTIKEWFEDEKSYKEIETILNYYDPASFYAIIYTGIGVGNNRGLLRLSKKYGIPLIRDIVDWFEYDKGNFLYRIVKTVETNRTVNFYTPKAHNVICISTFLKDYFDDKGCNTFVLPSLTHRGDVRFTGLPEYIRSDVIKLAYVGNPGKRGDKDRIDWCVRAFHECDNSKCELHICGISKDTFCSDFPEYANLTDDDNIMFYGKVPNRECVELIATSDYLVFAREDKQATRAGFPTKLSEAFAIGTPVVTTPSGDISLYLKNGVNGFVSDTCTYQSFRESLSRAIKANDELVMDMHTKCKTDSPLFETHWSESLNEYLKTI